MAAGALAAAAGQAVAGAAAVAAVVGAAGAKAAAAAVAGCRRTPERVRLDKRRPSFGAPVAAMAGACVAAAGQATAGAATEAGAAAVAAVAGVAASKAAVAGAASCRQVARIAAAAFMASSRDVERAGGPPAFASMSRRSAGQGRGAGQGETRVTRGDIRCELEVQEASRSKLAGSPEVLSTMLALLEAPVSKVSVGTAVRT